MAAGQGQIIQLSDYTTIKNKVDAVFGTGSGDSGYGQPSTTITKFANSTVSHNEWVALRNDMAKVRQHQIGGTIGTSTALDGGNLVDLSVINPPPILITEAIRNQYDNFSNIITTNRFLIDNNNKSTSSATSATYTNEWNGTLIHTLAMTGISTGDGSANNIRYFFNSGGVINFSASRTGTGTVIGTNAINEKYAAWTTLLNAIGSISFGYTSTTTTGNGVGSAIGWYDLTTSDQLVYQLLGSNVPALNGTEYEPNAYQIYAKKDTNNTSVTFSIKFCDFDINGTDINIGGTLTSGLVQVYASSANVLVSPLVLSNEVGNNTFSNGYVSPQYYVSPSITDASQGSTITFTTITQYVSNNTILYWRKTTGSSVSDSRLINATGSFIINNNSGLFTINIASDTTTHPDESFQIQLYTDANYTELAGLPSGEITIRGTNSITTVNTYGLGTSYFIGSSSWSILSAGSNGMLTNVTIVETLTSIGTADDGTQWQNGYSTLSGNYSTIDSIPTNGNISIGASIATSTVGNGNTLTIPVNYVLTGIATTGYLYGTGNQNVTLSTYLLIAPLLDSSGNVIPVNKIININPITDTLTTSWNTSDTTNIIPNGTVIRSVKLTAAAGAHYLTCTAEIVYDTLRINK